MNRLSSVLLRRPSPKHMGKAFNVWNCKYVNQTRPLSGLVPKKKDEIRVEAWENKDFIQNYQWFLKAIGYYSKSSILARGASSLFRAAKFGGTRKAFYSRGNVVNDFRSQQVLITAHIWAIHKRLVKEGNDGRLVQEILFDELWNDTMGRIRSFKFAEITINKHLRSVQEYCFGALISFDHAVSFETEEEVRQQMHDAVRAHVYNHDKDIPDAKVDAVADYVLSEMKSLQEIELEPFLHGRIRWDNAPSFGLKKVSEGDEVEILGQVGAWRKEYSIDGKEYYWNMDTYESTFDKPPEMP
mmetsp:Transcript_27300/g.35213  ORF Transcript_27300/g.35213 Transcript_27300/m.35213 type:complete len:299 (+) Transcript_27300:166-1062(+)